MPVFAAAAFGVGLYKVAAGFTALAGTAAAALGSVLMAGKGGKKATLPRSRAPKKQAPPRAAIPATRAATKKDLTTSQVQAYLASCSKEEFEEIIAKRNTVAKQQGADADQPQHEAMEVDGEEGKSSTRIRSPPPGPAH